MLLIAVFGGSYYVLHRIDSYAPTLLSLGTSQEGTQSDARLAELAELKLVDSDGDGISDFDELYVYKTSQYLEDTDGDGINDGDEVASGNDPNCANGNNCTEIRAIITDSDNGSIENASAELDDFLTAEDMSPEELRTQLATMGVPSSTLDQVSDDELVEVYSSVKQDYLAAQDSTAEVATDDYNPDSDITLEDVDTSTIEDILPDTSELPEDSLLGKISSVDDLSNLQPNQIRDLLKQGGMTDDEVNSFDDTTLVNLYQETFQTEVDNQQLTSHA